jgi:hypothetical protein
VTPVEKLQAAIDKLESLTESSTRGPWIAVAGLDDDGVLTYSLIGEDSTGSFEILDAATDDESISLHQASANSDLVEVLHACIPAMLAVLRDGLDRAVLTAEQGPGWLNDPSRWVERVPSDLAAAILGAGS